MKRLSLLATAALLFFTISCNHRPHGNPRILVFSKTNGFRHSSIADGKKAIQLLGKENHIEVDTTEDAAMFNEDTLRKYAAVVFLNTTDSRDALLDVYQENAFTRYIEAGGGFVGIHAAADAGYRWGWYGRLVGAYFNGHPDQQEALIRVTDNNHPATQDLPENWKRTDEWYNFKNFAPDLHVLLRIDESSYKGGTNGADHPVAWYHAYDGGRAFYTELGHTEASYIDPLYLKHLLGGIRYAIGDNEPLDYSKATMQKTPPEAQFTKTTLSVGQFSEPTEMTILPNLDILIAQRRGEIMLYKHGDTLLRQAGLLKVYHQATRKGVNAEEGLLGIKIDPDFERNHFVYVFYSPLDTSVNRLSRFTFVNDSIDRSSEKIILQFFSQRNICCHTGGSIAFGKDHLLFVSTGDNSTPFDEPGEKYPSRSYAPLDDRPGHEQYDSRRTAGNSNDLRGKILRIRVREDGSYDIPDGNLFPKGQEKTRPEIYVMGDRNPYRISVDQRNGFLYWGEVGPDANNDSAGRGPRGYDEVNQARSAGYYGWPLFVGHNYAYSEYDYATGKMGMTFDPAKPVNNSRNNTGLRDLPPARPAFIWYPYAPSPDFPQVGSGGRNAMAGPVFYSALYGNKGLPDYYNGKLFIYDFIRGWIKAITLRPNGDFDNMEPFMPHMKMTSPIDMEMGPDGKIYILEYGTGWFTRNPDAGLYRIDFDSTVHAVMPPASSVNRSKPPVDSAAFAHSGHQRLDDAVLGKNIVAQLDCKICHKVDGTSIGPAFTAVAAKYAPTSKNVNYLVKKIQNGGSGVWGEVAMPAHPALPSEDGEKIVAYILSLRKK